MASATITKLVGKKSFTVFNCNFLKPNGCINLIEKNKTFSSYSHGNRISNAGEKVKTNLKSGPSLEHFIANSKDLMVDQKYEHQEHPFIKKEDISGNGRKVYFETYGCQMNVNDTDIAWTILKENGFEKTSNIEESDVVLIMTCAIRESAEEKIWNRIEQLKYLKNNRLKNYDQPSFKIGILGCMAERLKTKILEKEKLVDIIAGPDSYRDLPRLLALASSGQSAVNVMLSLEETYADITPVRVTENSVSSFISVMRGCDNMCSFCIVPFTRGRERSRPIESIVDEVRFLFGNGIKEITLLGQNVNSYCDTSEKMHTQSRAPTILSSGFRTVYKPKLGGKRFAELLDKVSLVNPEMRIRFTSPHPKDFPDEVLQIMKERVNICKQIHLPAQSGSTKVLSSMRRGYSKEAYLDLVQHIRNIIPEINLSSDFICGFCGETDEDFEETLSMIKTVKYNFIYFFPYSMRAKTHAYHKLVDDVPHEVKISRCNKLSKVFREEAEQINKKMIGSQQLVLVEKKSKRSDDFFEGRNDGNTKVIFPHIEVPCGNNVRKTLPGDYLVVQINDASSQVLKGIPLYISTLQQHSNIEDKYSLRN